MPWSSQKLWALGLGLKRLLSTQSFRDLGYLIYFGLAPRHQLSTHANAT